MPDVTALRELADIQVGFAFKSARFAKDSLATRLLRGDNIGQGRLRWDGAVSWPDSDVDDRYALREGDLVIAMDRPWIDAGLKFASVTKDDLPSYLVQRVARLRAKEGVDQRFLKYVVSSPEFTAYVLSVQTGTAVPHISGGQILEYPAPVLDSKHQRAIADVLGALDDKIAANDRIGALSKELLAAVFRRLEVDEAGDTSLEDLIELNPRLRVDGTSEVPYLEMKNLPDSSMTVSEWSHRAPRGGARFQNGDTLLARITPCLENGKVGMVDFLSGAQVGVGSTEFIVMRARPGIPTALPYFLATSDRFREFAIRHMVGTTGRQRLAAADLAPYTVRRPSSGALNRFGSLAEVVLARVKAAVDESRVLARARDELLPLLMSGRIRVKDAEKMAEEAV